MANQNTIGGFYNFSQSVAVNTEVAALVPSSGYPGFPTPALVAGAGLVASAPADIAGGELDGHLFRLRVAGTITTAGAYTASVGLYQVPAASLGVIGSGSTAQVTSAGAPGSGATVVGAKCTATSISTATVNFHMSFLLMWDKVSGALNGLSEYAMIANSILAAPAKTTAIASPITSVGVADLNFMPTITFGTAGANSWLVRECVIERV